MGNKLKAIIVLLCLMITFPITASALNYNKNPNTYEKLITKVLEQMRDRKETFTITYEGDITPFKNKEVDLLDDLDYYDNYTSWSYTKGNMSIQRTESAYDFTFTFNYISTYEEEQYATEKLEEVISEHLKDDMTDKEKLDIISNWIMDLVSYDDTLSHRSIYDAITEHKVVCHGYALLFELFCEKVGINSQLVFGYIIDETNPHLWNVVYLDNEWLYVDLTNTDYPINIPLYLVKEEQLEEYNFIWDKSLINFTVNE